MDTDYYNSLPEVDKQGRPFLLLEPERRSAFKPTNRPVFKQLLDMAERGEVYGVIAVHYNRISRNHLDTGQFVQRLADGQITRFDSVTDRRQYTGQDTSAIFMLSIEAANGWKDSSDKGKIISQRMELRAGEGKHMGRKPFGFLRGIELRPDGSEFRTTIHDPERLPHVIEIFRMASTGTYSLADIAKWAEKKKIRAKPAKNNPTGVLKQNTIGNILHDPYYKGYVRFKGKLSSWEGKQGAPAIDPPISEELWNRVQLMLLQRCTNTARVKVETLRKRFIYGSTVRCGKCGGALSPYKVEKKSGKAYIYYECKNRKTRCKVAIPQDVLSKQYDKKVRHLYLPQMELDRVRELLLKLHKEKSVSRIDQHKGLSQEYERIEREITERLGTLKKAEEMGVGKEAEACIKKLGEERDSVCRQMSESQEEGGSWIDKTIRSFELLRLTEEALRYGSPQIREAVLKSIASNHALIDGELVCELKSPFKEAYQREGHPEWWAILDSNQ